MSNGKKILLVEDDRLLSDLYKEILGSADYEVEIVTDGFKAEEAMKQGGYDLVLLDVMMPQRSGIEILESLSGKEKERCGKIVMFSNMPFEDLPEHSAKLGVAAFLNKFKLDPGQLLAKIEALLK
ncbi:response regulator [Patescibacteria group bacterium]|nr:response regulator [Patescibacteria group bacterium]MBU1867842.1 response regulator [Patescibacteria group bacterium]